MPIRAKRSCIHPSCSASERERLGRMTYTFPGGSKKSHGIPLPSCGCETTWIIAGGGDESGCHRLPRLSLFVRIWPELSTLSR